LERIKAQEFSKQLLEPPSKSSQPKKKKPFTASVGEKILSQQVRSIKVRTQDYSKEEAKMKQAQELLTDPPLASGVISNARKFGLPTENKVSEWEKNDIKEVFLKYDTDKSGYLDIEEMSSFLQDLRQNKAGIGKVPVIDDFSVIETVKQWDKNMDNKIHWKEFAEGMNSWDWKIMDKEQLDSEVKELYSKARKEAMKGKKEEAKALVMKALKLQGVESRNQKMFEKKPPPEQPKLRFDSFKVYQLDKNKTFYEGSIPKKLSSNSAVL